MDLKNNPSPERSPPSAPDLVARLRDFDPGDDHLGLREEAADEIERLLAALLEYGSHAESCPEGSDVGDGMCNCGFSEALRGAGEKT